MNSEYFPATISDFQEIVRMGNTLRIIGKGTKSDFGKQVYASQVIRTSKYSGIIEWSPEDLVVVVKAGTPICELQSELSLKNQRLPIPEYEDELGSLLAGIPGTVGGMVATNLPTKWDYFSRGPRYWVLGISFVTGTGDIVKCGSKAVKNVAGYDVQKLHIGALGTLGILTEVILRLSSITKDTPVDNISGQLKGYSHSHPIFVSRGKRNEEEVDGIWCRESGIRWSNVESDNCIGRGTVSIPSNNLDWLQSIKHLSDPNHIFNPGIMGVF